MFSMFHYLIYMCRMLIMWLIGLYYRWNQKENSNENLSAFFSGNSSCSGTKQSRKLSVVEALWDRGSYMVDVWSDVFDICVLVYVYAYVYCVYCNVLCYKALINSGLCYHSSRSPRLRKSPTEVTTDQYFDLVASPTKSERDLSKGS